MHEAEGVVVGALQAQRAAHLPGIVEAMGVECLVDDGIAEVEHAHRYGAYLEVAHADEPPVGGLDTHHGALLDLALGHTRQCAREYPGVKAVERLLFAAAQPQSGVFVVCIHRSISR